MSRQKLVYTCALMAVCFNLVAFPSISSDNRAWRHTLGDPWQSWESPDWFRFFVWLAVIAVVTVFARMTFGRKRSRAEVVHGKTIPISR